MEDLNSLCTCLSTGTVDKRLVPPLPCQAGKRSRPLSCFEREPLTVERTAIRRVGVDGWALCNRRIPIKACFLAEPTHAG